MWYMLWLHRTIARWRLGPQATLAVCNELLAEFAVLGDLHPGNVVVTGAGVVVVDFELRTTNRDN